jgi:hypothetical protein
MDKTSENPKDWVRLTGDSVSSTLINSPNIRSQPKQGLPGIEIQMKPIDNKTGQPIFLEKFPGYPAPIYVKDVQSWKESPEIQNHQVKGWAGAASENQELFSKPKTLKNIIALKESHKNDLGITDDTKVVHLNTVLPIDSQGKFTAEFVPKIWHPKLFERETNDNRKTSYKLTVIEGDRINAYQQLMGSEPGREVHQVTPDEENTSKTENRNWKPNYVPDMGELQKQLINGSNSRMIIIATPYELKQESASPTYYSGDSSSSPPPMYMGASVGQVRVSEGSYAGRGTLADEELKKSEQKPVIFVIDYLGVKPEDARGLKGSLK